MRHLVALGTILLSSFVLSIVGTLLMLPLWRWLENTYGLEAVGHSGPAEWCYLLTFLVCLLAGTVLYAVRSRRST